MADRTSSAMSDAPDREFEIVLGNKQLFSLLFIVFVLLGVFFAMGYLMGRNTLPVDTAAAPRSGATTAGQVPTATSAGDDRPSATEPASTTATTPDPERAARPAPTAEATERRVAPPPDPTPAPLTVVEPKPGQTFLQVSAINRPEAELLVEVLQKKGFRAILAPGPKENIFRVLVGPEKDDAELAKVRTQLEQSGFKPIPRRY